MGLVHGLLGGDLLVKELLDQHICIVDHIIPSIWDGDIPMFLFEVAPESVATITRPLAIRLRAIQTARQMLKYVMFQVLPSTVRLVAI